MGDNAMAVATSVASFWQLAVTVDGSVDDTAPGSAVPNAATSELSVVTTALLVVAHFTVPTTLLAAAVEVVVDGSVVVLVLALDEHPVIATAATTIANPANSFLMVSLSPCRPSP